MNFPEELAEVFVTTANIILKVNIVSNVCLSSIAILMKIFRVHMLANLAIAIRLALWTRVFVIQFQAETKKLWRVLVTARKMLKEEDVKFVRKAFGI
jgi:hypothetical protein